MSKKANSFQLTFPHDGRKSTLNEALVLPALKAQTNTKWHFAKAAPAVLMRVSKTLNLPQVFLSSNTSKRQAGIEHVTRFPYQFQKLVIHLSVSSPAISLLSHSGCNTVLQNEVVGFTWHNIRKSACSHSALSVTAEGKKRRRVDSSLNRCMLSETFLQQGRVRRTETESSVIQRG